MTPSHAQAGQQALEPLQEFVGEQGDDALGDQLVQALVHRVHRLVAQAFLPPPPSEKHTIVNHIDGDRANNRADNLEWVTPSENIRHSYATNAERKSGAPKQSKPVLGRRHGSEGEWVEYESTAAAARALGLDSGNVSACCRGRLKRTGEYEFKWAPPAEDQHDRPGEEWREVQLECGASRMVSNLGRVITARGIKTEGSEHPSGYRDARINGKSAQACRSSSATTGQRRAYRWPTLRANAYTASKQDSVQRSSSIRLVKLPTNPSTSRGFAQPRLQRA